MLEQQPDIFALIPQRPPIMMIDTVIDASDNHIVTQLTIQEDNIFVENNIFHEAGIIEHIAQSAAAFAGWQTYNSGQPPRIGYIGEIKNCHIHALPKQSHQLQTHLQLMAQAGDVSLVQTQTTANGHIIADCQMKISLKAQ
ncbi:MAG: hydroxymyristoyl-ACP dehydratase [Paludibacteraceae bacterium]|nr:hydroxymyristoyl-ACP dehydratase [Paludibacteraceae bacterium]